MSEPLRIAYLTSQFARPSDTFIRHEVNQLRALGLDVRTFSIRRPDAGATADADVAAHQRDTEYLVEHGALRIAGSAFKRLLLAPGRTLAAAALAWKTRPPGVRGTLRQGAYLLEALRLAERIEALDLKLIHNHIGENSATVAMLAAAATGRPFSLTIHGPGIFFAAGQWALGVKLDRAAFTACISDFCRSQCMAFAAPATWPRLHVVRCAVPPLFAASTDDDSKSDRQHSSRDRQGAEFLTPSLAGASNPPPTFVSVGRLCPEKAQRLAVEAAARLRAEGRRFRLRFLGDGPDRAELAAAIAAAGLGDVIELAGWQSSEQIAAALRGARALILPSLAEGLPIVIMEALALGVPVISTRVAAIPELVETGVTGWLAAPGNVDELVAAMRAALDASPEMLTALGDEGRRRVAERHDPRRQALQLKTLLERA